LKVDWHMNNEKSEYVVAGGGEILKMHGKLH
jgi:hypothetical protein